MRITFVCPSLTLSGGIKVICTYAEHLQQMGHDVTMIAPPIFASSLKDKVKSIIVGNGWLLDPIPHYPANVKCIILDSNREIVASDVPDADAIVATWWKTAEWVAAMPSSKGRKFYFVQGHEVLWSESARTTYKLPLRKIVVSKWLQDVMKSEYDEPSTLILNTVDRNQFCAPPRNKQNEPTIGLLYGYSASKGFDVAVKAVEQTGQQIRDLRVIAFGMERVRAPFRLPPQADFHLRPTPAHLVEIYRSCDVWLTASRTEGFNLPALEAMACRTPVVSTKAGWPLDGIVDRVNGRLVDVDDIDAISEALCWVLTRSNDEWRRLSEAASQTMTLRTWREGAELFEKEIKAAQNSPLAST